MARVYVGMGSNMERVSNIRSGVAALRDSFGELSLSRVYDCKAVGFEGGDFFNLVAGFYSRRPVMELVEILQHIEAVHGRRRDGERLAPRPLDLDLLLYDDLIMQQDGVCLPRDEILEYAFVLRPLAEIAPQGVHPVVGRTFSQLWREFNHASQSLSPVDIGL